MPAGIADILCITQITFTIVQNALLANYRWFWLTHLRSSHQTPYVQNYLFKFKFVTCYMHILRFIALHGIYYVVNFILFSLENDDMESSKRCVTLLSLISSFQLLKFDFYLFNIHVMMTFVDMAPKFGVMIKHQDSFFCARQPASSVNFRFGHSITKSY